MPAPAQVCQTCASKAQGNLTMTIPKADMWPVKTNIGMSVCPDDGTGSRRERLSGMQLTCLKG